MTAFIRVQDSGEHARRVKVRDTHRLDARVDGDDGRGTEVANQCVVLDPADNVTFDVDILSDGFLVGWRHVDGEACECGRARKERVWGGQSRFCSSQGVRGFATGDRWEGNGRIWACVCVVKVSND